MPPGLAVRLAVDLAMTILLLFAMVCQRRVKCWLRPPELERYDYDSFPCIRKLAAAATTLKTALIHQIKV
jgi:hypothetical protein